MNEQVEMDREGYLKRLLRDIVENRKCLPIFIVDNTDEFPPRFKEILFQYFQALRRHAAHCLLLFPLTDRSAWAFAKSELFNIYSSRSYFLPTPPPREIFRKRLEYFRHHVLPIGKTRGSYESGTLRIKLENLEAFALAIEDIFVHQDYISNRLGSLANYNIRKTLSLARRAITSSALCVDDLIKSYIIGNQEPLAPEKFMLALILGDYNFYKRGDAHFVFPIFEVSSEIAQSPLINVRLLALLKAIHDSRSSDDSRYTPVPSIAQYFDGMGYTERAVETALASLITVALVEPHDPSIGGLGQAQRVAISHSGLAHLEMALFNITYFEQMALTTLVANSEAAAQIRSHYEATAPLKQRLRKVRETFARYLIEEDERFGRVPHSEQYNVQSAVTSDVRKFSGGTSEDELSERDAVVTSAQPGLVAGGVSGIVDWFDEAKGYGFVTIEQLGESAFLHASVLERSGIGLVHDGDALIVDIARSHKGIAVSDVKRNDSGETTQILEAVVIKVFRERGYGFVYVPRVQTHKSLGSLIWL